MSENHLPACTAQLGRELASEENLQWLQCLDEVRVKTIRYYLDHPEQLDAAEPNIRRHFGLDLGKYGDWSTAAAA